MTAMVEIAKIRLGERHRRDLGDLRGLADSIRDRGLLHPVVLTPDGMLIAGYRRLKAIELLGWDTVPVRVVDIDSIVLGERDENMQRKDFTPTEAVALGRLIETRERELAKARMLAGRPSGHLPEGVKGETRERVGKAVGMSGTTYDRAKRVVEAAESDPKRLGDLSSKMDEKGIWAANRELKARQAKTDNDGRKDTRQGRPLRRAVPLSRALATLEGACEAICGLDLMSVGPAERQVATKALTGVIRQLVRMRKRLIGRTR